MKSLKFSLSVMMAALLACAASAQSERNRIDPDHSTASIYVDSAHDPSSAINVAIAKVSGTAYWDRDNPSNSVFNLYIYPAVKDAQLLAEDGSLRKDAVLNLARYTLLTFQSKTVALDPTGKLVVTGDITITYAVRQSSLEWSVAYAGGASGELNIQTSTHEVRLTVENVAPNEGREWPAAKPDLFGSIVTTEEAVSGLKHAVRDAVWPIVVEDERCVMPSIGGDLGMRAYQGAICTGSPILVEPSGKMPAWSGAGYSGTVGPDPEPLNRISILLRLRLLEPKLPKAKIPPE